MDSRQNSVFGSVVFAGVSKALGKKKIIVMVLCTLAVAISLGRG